MSEPRDPRDRSALLRAVSEQTHDVIVIGGGINGAGIARDAALRGLSVLLLERDDYGFGTTWRSTKLIHGGLRYLEHREWRLVREGLRERAGLLRTAPHLVRPLQFLVPVFRGGRYGRRLIQAGMVLYDLLSAGKDLPRHRALSVGQAAELEPSLDRDAITGAFTYYDAQVALPERLCLENVLSAQTAGARAFNHVSVTGLLAGGGRVYGVAARDLESGRGFEARGRVVVNAAGPWVDSVLRNAGLSGEMLGGTRGCHIVVDFAGSGLRRAIYAEAGADGRPFFIIPWRGRHLIGTTDTRFDGDPANVLPDAADIAYLRQETGRVLPGAPLSDEMILYAFAGVRPLPRTADGREGAITRRHFIRSHEHDGLDGLLTIIGGKLTSYRALAEETVDTICRRLGKPAASSTATGALVPGTEPPGDQPLLRSLISVYGPRASAVLALARIEPSLGAPLCPHGSEIGAQVIHAARHEGARTVGDVLLRRTPAGWNPCLGLDAAPGVATLLAQELGWDQARVAAEVAAYRDEVRRTFVAGAGAAVTPACV
ncbi:MAG: glycerol-3-phosphate dehydrogenase/oxidase [Chloroflexi bacterium]|nr:glycerol-3-phosphate dehydrogenase/oxidase [Chloroflexota bacterium]